MNFNKEKYFQLELRKNIERILYQKSIKIFFNLSEGQNLPSSVHTGAN